MIARAIDRIARGLEVFRREGQRGAVLRPCCTYFPEIALQRSKASNKIGELRKAASRSTLDRSHSCTSFTLRPCWSRSIWSGTIDGISFVYFLIRLSIHPVELDID